MGEDHHIVNHEHFVIKSLKSYTIFKEESKSYDHEDCEEEKKDYMMHDYWNQEQFEESKKKLPNVTAIPKVKLKM